MLTLYYSPRSCSFAAHIALEEAGAKFDPVKVDFAANEQNGPAYRKLNPKGRVPLLVTPQGTISEVPAILTYVALAYPQAKLAPVNDPLAFSQILSLCAYLSSTVHPAHAHMRRGYRWSDDPAVIDGLKVKVPANMTECFHIIETEYFTGPWVAGEAYSIADPYLYTIARWLESDGVDATQFPKIHDHRRRMALRPAVVRADSIHNAD